MKTETSNISKTVHQSAGFVTYDIKLFETKQLHCEVSSYHERNRDGIIWFSWNAHRYIYEFRIDGDRFVISEYRYPLSTHLGNGFYAMQYPAPEHRYSSLFDFLKSELDRRCIVIVDIPDNLYTVDFFKNLHEIEPDRVQYL